MHHDPTAGRPPIERHLEQYLEWTGRDGDPARIARRLTAHHVAGSQIVGFRRAGREALCYRPPAGDRPGVLTIQDVARDGTLSLVAEVWTGRQLEPWLRHHVHYLEWITPPFRALFESAGGQGCERCGSR